MFNDIGALEIVTLVVLAVLIFGPDKLPKVIQDAARFIRKIREFSDSAKRDIREELGPEFKDFEFEDLNPKTFLRKQIDNDEYGLKDIRSSLDLKKEMADITDVVHGRDSDEGFEKEPEDAVGTSGRSGGRMDLTKKADLTKKPEKLEAGARPPFDMDAT
ncbi:sec-independent translocase [Streptomyces tsukubensis]|uniref:Sec-independent protein translocase protein TatB n=1 Tax=Streptomyces tsukubensis TaxID=83656 RepID=A0A1V4ACT6_9ACTN|nr:sec-independent translocase [Streptomyces tsukubensis]OON81299.1 Sec-independent protein translocase TatB [Streptomyces tsukubensis]QFR95587.1 Sec-independent protein translocase TatB [Streptomyces tsukubensis]